MSVMAETRIRITVEGVPKPKGSLKHIGRGRLVEQVAGSGTWRNQIAWAARKQYAGDPISTPAVVDFEVRVAAPKSAPKRRVTMPATRSSGDVDKHARSAARVYAFAGLPGFFGGGQYGSSTDRSFSGSAAMHARHAVMNGWSPRLRASSAACPATRMVGSGRTVRAGSRC